MIMKFIPEWMILAQNAAQKNETFILLAVFALIGCGLIASFFSKTPYTKEKAIKKPLIILSIMAIFIFFVVYALTKYNS